MDETKEGGLQQLLATAKQEVAPLWEEALPTADAAVRYKMVALTEAMLPLLWGEPLNSKEARQLGAELAGMRHGAALLVQSQELLTRWLTEQLPPQQLVALHPKLARLLGEVGQGFVAAQAHQVESFLSFTRHELLTSLNVIMGFAALLLDEVDGPLNEAQQQNLVTICNAEQHHRAFLRNIFDLCKSAVGGIDIAPRSFDIAKTLELRAAWDNGRRDRVTFQQRYGEDLGLMVADPARVRQLLENLLGSIRLCLKEGTVHLHGTRESAEGRDWLVLRVHTSGGGPSPEQLQEIREILEIGPPFLQDSHSSLSVSLLLSQHLAVMLGGSIQAGEITPASPLTIRLPVA